MSRMSTETKRRCNISRVKPFNVQLQHGTTWKKHAGHSCEQHMKHFSMWACVIVVSSKIIKSQTSCFKSEQVVPGSKSAGWGCVFFSSSSSSSSSLCSFFPTALLLLLLLLLFLLLLPTSELHYYQQSAFKSAPAQHQDVFCMLILWDTDPSLLRRSLMPGVPETAGKTVSARRSARTTRISGRHRARPQRNNTGSGGGSVQVKILRYKCTNTPLQGGISAFKSLKILKTDSLVELLTTQRRHKSKKDYYSFHLTSYSLLLLLRNLQL